MDFYISGSLIVFLLLNYNLVAILERMMESPPLSYLALAAQEHISLRDFIPRYLTLIPTLKKYINR